MKNTIPAPVFTVAAVVLALLALMQMVNGSYLPMLILGLAAGGIYWYKGQYLSQQAKMTTGVVGGSTEKFVTDPVVLAKIKEPGRDASNMKVNNLTKGSILEYDLKTWEAENMRLFYWTEGMSDSQHEVEKSIDFRSGKSKMNMRVMRDRAEETVPFTKDVNVFQVDSNMNKYISGGKFEPPTVLNYENEKFFRGSLKRGFNIDPQDNSYTVFESWQYLNTEKSKVLLVEHAGENSFNAQVGELVNKYQFENLLPAPKS